MTTTFSPESRATLRDAGLRVTGSRVAVLEALAELPHASADTVLERVAPQLEHPSPQSVYNALNDFAKAGLVRRIELAGQPQRYELRVGDNHHHLVCTECGAVTDIDCVVGEAPCLHPDDTNGYAITQAEVTFWGVCPACQAASVSSGSGAADPAA